MAGLNQVQPFVTKSITDRLIQGDISQGFRPVAILLALLLTVTLVQTALNRITWFMTNTFVVMLESHLKQMGFDHLMRLSLRFFNDQSSGKMMSKLDRGVNRIIAIVNNSGMHFLPSLATAIVSFAIVVSYQWQIGVSILIAFIPYIMINRWRFMRNSALDKEEYKLYDKQYSHFWEVLNSMQLIKAFRAEKFERQKLKDFFREYFRIRQTMESNTNKAAIGDIFLETWQWGVYAFISFLTFQGRLTVGTMVFLISLVRMIREPLWQLNWIFWEVKRAQIGAKDFLRIMEVEPEVVDPEQPLPLNEVKGEIKFENVTFRYKNNSTLPDDHDEETAITPPLKDADETPEDEKFEPGQLVFKDVSFTIAAGKTTALVGPSGSGKTTIAALAMRFFDPDSGRVTLDGVDLRDVRQFDLRKHLGLVSQDADLFATTIAENLRYAKPDATEEEMLKACRIAHAAEFIQKLPKGLETEIGDRGVKLSGGQRQRLSLARTILRDPQIIILDEATSALDSESEMYIQQALRELLKDRTALVIAHRLSTIQRADNIIVIKDTKVLEQGTHEELLKKDGLYASLFSIQSGDSSKLKEWDLVAD